MNDIPEAERFPPCLASRHRGCGRAYAWSRNQPFANLVDATSASSEESQKYTISAIHVSSHQNTKPDNEYKLLAGATAMIDLCVTKRESKTYYKCDAYTYLHVKSSDENKLSVRVTSDGKLGRPV